MNRVPSGGFGYTVLQFVYQPLLSGAQFGLDSLDLALEFIDLKRSFVRFPYPHIESSEQAIR
jgi:hypothetical protein